MQSTTQRYLSVSVIGNNQFSRLPMYTILTLWLAIRSYEDNIETSHTSILGLVEFDLLS